jgi:hypothetical protein
MADIQFDTNPSEFGTPPQGKPGWDLTGQIVSLGLAKTREQAEYLLIGVAVLAIIIAAYFLFHSGGGEMSRTPVYSLL